MSHINITILGTTAGAPTKNRAHTSIYLNYDDGEETCLLFDCGEGTQRQIMSADLNFMKLDNIFITHWHGDHCLGLPGLTDTMGFEDRKHKLNIYAPEVKRAKNMRRFSRSVPGFELVLVNAPSSGKKITTLFRGERFDIVSTPATHSVPTVAYALVEKDKRYVDPEKAANMGLPEKGEIYREIKESSGVVYEGRKITYEEISSVRKGKKVVYSGDTRLCDNLERLARDADLLVQDCTYFTETPPDRQYEHAAFPEIMQMVKEAGVKRVVLTHIGRKYEDMSELRKLAERFNGAEVAEDFMKVVV